jgi:hypothetical protein
MDILKHNTIMTPTNVLIEILEKYPNRNWNWISLSKNPGITYEYIESHPTNPWNFLSMSENPNLTLENIEKIITRHNDIDIDLWWNNISSNINITSDFVMKYSTKAWNWVELFKRLLRFSIEFQESRPDIPWDISRRSQEYHLTLQEILQKEFTDYSYLSENPNINFDYVLKHSNRSWNWSKLSSNPGITLSDIENGKLSWNWSLIAPEFPEIDWDWVSISKRNDLTLDFIKKYWFVNMSEINRNPIVESLTVSTMCNSPNLTLEYLESKSTLFWNTNSLSSNPFQFHPFLVKKRDELFRQVTRPLIKLQQRFLHRYYRPTSKLFKERMTKKIYEIMHDY